MLKVPIIIFIVLEISNVLVLYLKPDFKYGNSLAVFYEYDEYKGSRLFNYLIKWVANSKIIFIGLLILILAMGSNRMLLVVDLLMPGLISAYYLFLAPILKEMESDNLVTSGYRKQLGIIIFVFILMFIGSVLIELF